MKVKVYQLIVVNKNAGLNDRVCKFRVIGIVHGKIDDPDTIWDLTNHSCWTRREKPGITRDRKAKYYPGKHNRGYTNDDICFKLGNLWYCADSVGWTKVKTKEEAMRHLWEHSNWIKDYLPENYKFEDIIQ